MTREKRFTINQSQRLRSHNMGIPKPTKTRATPKPMMSIADWCRRFSPVQQGSNYTLLKKIVFVCAGAVIRVACTAVDQHGYRKVPFSCLTEATDAKGYYFKTLPSSRLDDHLKITECKAYLESSPLKTCNVPTNMNDGISGAPLSAYRILHDKKMKLYSMRTFFYTSTKPSSTPAAVIASAAGYGDDKKPDTTKSKYSYDPKPQSDLPKPDYNSNPKPDLPKPDYNYNPKPDLLPKPKMTVPEQADGYSSKPFHGKPTIHKPDYNSSPKPYSPNQK
uniref:Uncharacterized protein n=1 Tax=Salix viminalis TaxID=40686 RepID=A0A6N2KU03_SALVM